MQLRRMEVLQSDSTDLGIIQWHSDCRRSRISTAPIILENCLTCLRDQTYRDIEVLISDNCSEDATGEIARRFCDADPAVPLFPPARK